MNGSFISNVCRECKNRYIFVYLKSLIDCGTFKHIYLSFLPVGHTHCDIDQMFSRLAVFLAGCLVGIFSLAINDNHNNYDLNTNYSVPNLHSPSAAHSAYSFEEMARAIKKAFADIQHVEALVKFTNFKDAMTPLLNTAAATPGLLHNVILKFSRCGKKKNTANHGLI